jgi:hypothetical protein
VIGIATDAIDAVPAGHPDFPSPEPQQVEADWRRRLIVGDRLVEPVHPCGELGVGQPDGDSVGSALGGELVPPVRRSRVAGSSTRASPSRANPAPSTGSVDGFGLLDDHDPSTVAAATTG